MIINLTKKSSAAAFLGALILISLPTPLCAQVAGAARLQAGQCMTSRTPILNEAAEQGNTIIVPASDFKTMMEKGFKPVACAKAFTSKDAQSAWRDQICTMTATQGEGVQDQLEVLLGERPAVLCGMAEQVLGPWERTGTAINR